MAEWKWHLCELGDEIYYMGGSECFHRSALYSNRGLIYSIYVQSVITKGLKASLAVWLRRKDGI